MVHIVNIGFYQMNKERNQVFPTCSVDDYLRLWFSIYVDLCCAGLLPLMCTTIDELGVQDFPTPYTNQ